MGSIILHAQKDVSPGRYNNLTIHSCKGPCRCLAVGVMESVAINMKKTGKDDWSNDNTS